MSEYEAEGFDCRFWREVLNVVSDDKWTYTQFDCGKFDKIVQVSVFLALDWIQNFVR